MHARLKYIFTLLLSFLLIGILHLQSKGENIEIDPQEYEKVIPPERFPIIENETFELFVDPGNYSHPIDAYAITSRFGLRSLKLTDKYQMGVHRGIDIAAPTGTPLYSILDGIVRISQHDSWGYGKVVIIRHKDGLESLYAHMDKLYVSPGDTVKSGDCIGLSGNTGVSTGPHLHFELSVSSGRFDPELVIDFRTGELRDIFIETEE